MMRRRRTWSEARYEDAAEILIAKFVGNKPGWGFPPVALTSQPAAGEIGQLNTMALAPVVIAEIGDLGAVHIVFTHRQRL